MNDLAVPDDLASLSHMRREHPEKVLLGLEALVHRGVLRPDEVPLEPDEVAVLTSYRLLAANPKRRLKVLRNSFRPAFPAKPAGIRVAYRRGGARKIAAGNANSIVSAFR
jgi:hypothetical protein